MTAQQKLKLLLNENIKNLHKAAQQLAFSYQRCQSTISLTGEQSATQLSLEDQEKFEALTSRIARLADLIIQKTIRLIEQIELSESGSILDRINKAEKKGFIESAEQFIEIRQLRNSIAHEYDEDALNQIFITCLQYTPSLLTAVENIKGYIELHPQYIMTP